MDTNSTRNAAHIRKHFEPRLTDVTVSICIVTYYARDLLRDCLSSLYESNNLDLEIIVVDNGSKDGVGEMLASDFPLVHFIENDRNLGYTQPMNQAKST
jgi:N-acetylglucosaminyl-diphospho-decaprenol L-rhamnosyltransferase